MGAGKGVGNSNKDDVIHGGASSVLRGGRGDDTYIIDVSGVSVDEKNNGGHDLVVSSVDYVLDANVEDLTLSGEDNLTGVGNSDANTITGNSGDNILAGAGGADTIDGGAGNDTAVFSGSSLDYLIVADGDGVYVTDADGQTSFLRNVETLSFDDGNLILLDPEPAPEPEPQPDPDPALDPDTVAQPLPEPEPAPVLPEANSDVGSGNEDTSIVLQVLANDVGTSLSLQSVGDAGMGRAVINSDNTITYTPDPDAFGTDSFTYTVIDSFGQTATGTIKVDVLPVNDAPVTIADHFDATGGAIFVSAESVLANDFDPDGDQVEVVGFDTVSENGAAITMNGDGTFSYEAAQEFSGTDRFSYTVRDTYGAEQQGWVELHVAPAAADPITEPVASDPTAPPDYVDALLAGEWFRLNAGEAYGTGATVTFAFASETPDYYNPDSAFTRNFTEFSEAQQLNTKSLLDYVASITGLTFVETSVSDAEMVFGFADIGTSGTAYWPSWNGVDSKASDVWLDDGLSGFDLASGTEAHTILLHEIGHALGLRHPDLPEAETNFSTTVMSDFYHPGMDGGEPSTFMTYDIAALQYLYGVNATHSAADDLYTVDDLEDRVLTIWDSGGVDTIDLSGASYAVEIDLRQGAHSSVTPTGSDNIAIAFGTEIENAIGGQLDDLLFGNELNNTLTGGGGADTFGFESAWGTDRITDFETGTDQIDLTGTGLTFGDLNIFLIDQGLMITSGKDSILLADETELIDETSFLF